MYYACSQFEATMPHQYPPDDPSLLPARLTVLTNCLQLQLAAISFILVICHPPFLSIMNSTGGQFLQIAPLILKVDLSVSYMYLSKKLNTLSTPCTVCAEQMYRFIKK